MMMMMMILMGKKRKWSILYIFFSLYSDDDDADDDKNCLNLPFFPHPRSFIDDNGTKKNFHFYVRCFFFVNFFSAFQDQIVEQHRTHSFIPNCEVIINHQRSILTLLRCIAMNIVIGGSIVYYLFYYITFILHNPIIRWIFLLISIIGNEKFAEKTISFYFQFFFTVIYALYMAFKSAKVSNYGEKKAKKMN